MLIVASSRVGEEEDALILVKGEEKETEFGWSEKERRVLVLRLGREGTQTEHWTEEAIFCVSSSQSATKTLPRFWRIRPFRYECDNKYKNKKK